MVSTVDIGLAGIFVDLPYLHVGIRLSPPLLASILKVDDSARRLGRKVMNLRSDKISKARRAYARTTGKLFVQAIIQSSKRADEKFLREENVEMKVQYDLIQISINLSKLAIILTVLIFIDVFMRLQKFDNAVMAASVRDCYRISSFSINKLGTGSATKQKFY